MGSSDLLTRLPHIWGRLDTQGILERFLSVLDNDLNKVEDLITELLRVHNIDKIRDEYIYLLSTLVGNIWRENHTRQWNRERTRLAVPWHSYKGTWSEIDDLIHRHGGGSWDSVDMMGQILVPGSQGCAGGLSSYLIGATLYHPGARKLIVDQNLDFTSFVEDFLPTRAAGEVWFLYVQQDTSVEFETAFTFDVPTSYHDTLFKPKGLGVGRPGIDLYFQPVLNKVLFESILLE